MLKVLNGIVSVAGRPISLSGISEGKVDAAHPQDVNLSVHQPTRCLPPSLTAEALLAPIFDLELSGITEKRQVILRRISKSASSSIENSSPTGIENCSETLLAMKLSGSFEKGDCCIDTGMTAFEDSLSMHKRIVNTDGSLMPPFASSAEKIAENLFAFTSSRQYDVELSFFLEQLTARADVLALIPDYSESTLAPDMCQCQCIFEDVGKCLCRGFVHPEAALTDKKVFPAFTDDERSVLPELQGKVSALYDIVMNVITSDRPASEQLYLSWL